MLTRIALYDLIPDDDAAIRWCRSNGILLSSIKCPVCEAGMLEVRETCIDGRIWKCSKTINGVRHYKKISIRHNTFFSKIRFGFKYIIYLIYEWAVSISIDQAAFQLTLPKKAITGIFKSCRDQAAW